MTASTSLLWRLNEVFHDEGRGGYLKAGDSATRFEKYKQLSTLYRLACVIGWKHALERELSFLPHETSDNNQDVQSAFDLFEKALADGPHVERERLFDLARLWQLNLPDDDRELYKIGVALEQCIHEVLKKSNTWEEIKLSSDEQNPVCLKASETICSQINAVKLSPEILQETKHRALRAIFRKEAWLYRDWQSGVGSLMVKETKRGERVFEVVGYKEFERMWEGDDEEEKRWLGRLAGIIKEVDVSGADKNDARVNQLKHIMQSTAILVLALAKIKWYKKTVSAKTIEMARKLSAQPK